MGGVQSPPLSAAVILQGVLSVPGGDRIYAPALTTQWRSAQL